MPTYLYCVLTRGDHSAGPAAVALRGIGDTEVRVLPVGDLEAWVSTVTSLTPAPTVDAVKDHDRVVNGALATGRTPLPARFGQTWASDAACSASIAARQEELRPLLRRVAGLVEMTVHTLLPGMPPALTPPIDGDDEPRPGRAYLQTLRAQADRERHLRTALDAVRRQISGALGPLSRGEVAEMRGSDRALALSVSYLVERGAEDHFRETVETVGRELATRLVVAGPRAPYSFTPAPRQPGRAWVASASSG